MLNPLSFSKSLASLSLAATPSILVLVSLWLRMGGDLFPPFHDGGNWLKMANAMMGTTYPMWEQTVLQYPPLFSALLAFSIITLRDGLLAIKLMGTLVFALIPLAAYLLAKEVADSRAAGLVAAWLMAFHPVFQEMFGWGGYPNALGLVFLLLSVYFILRAYREGRRRSFLGALVCSSLLVLSHHLSTIVFFSIALGLFAFYLWVRLRKDGCLEGRGTRWAAFSFAVASAVFLLWRAAAGPFQYVVFNPASLTARPFDADAFWWIFKSQPVTALLFLASILGAFTLKLRGKLFELALLATWTLFPFIFTQSYVFGIALDFKRFPLFSVPPLVVLSSCSLSIVQGRLTASAVEINASGSNLRQSRQLQLQADPHALLIASILILLLCGMMFVGAAVQQSVFAYYHYVTDYAYSDKERAEALNWIRENTPSDAVVVADDAFGRWVEGLANRRVLMALPPFQAFMVGEVDRYKAADLILHSNVEIRNEFVRVRDETPHSTRRTPWFAVSKGNDFKDLFYIVDAYNRFSFEYEGSRWVEAPYRPEEFSMSWLEKGPSKVAISMKFATHSFVFEKVLSLEAGSAEATLSYSATPIKPMRLESFNISVWFPFRSSARALWYGAMPFELEVDGEPVLLWSDPTPKSASLGPDPEGGQLRFLLTYNSSENKFHVTLRFAFPSAVRSTWSTGVEGLTSDEVIKAYGVTHIAVSKRLYDMERIYVDQRFRQVYSNLKIAVFEVEGVHGRPIKPKI